MNSNKDFFVNWERKTLYDFKKLHCIIYCKLRTSLVMEESFVSSSSLMSVKEGLALGLESQHFDINL